jgi:hypothetical protein
MARLLECEIVDGGVRSDGNISASIEPPSTKVAVVVGVGG